MTGNARLTLKTERKRSLQEIADSMREDLRRNYPEIRTFDVSAGGGAGGQTNVKLEVYGNDLP